MPLQRYAWNHTATPASWQHTAVFLTKMLRGETAAGGIATIDLGTQKLVSKVQL